MDGKIEYDREKRLFGASLLSGSAFDLQKNCSLWEFPVLQSERFKENTLSASKIDCSIQ